MLRSKAKRSIGTLPPTDAKIALSRPSARRIIMPARHLFALTLPVPQPEERDTHWRGSLLPRARRILAWALRCAERSAERRVLAEFGDWQLRDIGVSRAEAASEAAKWFWQR
jgi:uncharacterized protein YjiS (DUF1127 family)